MGQTDSDRGLTPFHSQRYRGWTLREWAFLAGLASLCVGVPMVCHLLGLQ